MNQSLVGALVMIIPFFVSKHLRKVRHRMILGLAINDLVQAITVGQTSLTVCMPCLRSVARRYWSRAYICTIVRSRG